MIDRYSLPEMKKLWSRGNKFSIWLEIEILACEAWAELGKIPPESMAVIKKKADFNLPRIDELEKDLRHDVIAFLTCVAEYVGPDSRYIHMGLTSSDIGDTAICVQLIRAGELILEKLDALIDVLRRRALEHRDALIVGRTHGVHAEPTVLGLKFLLWMLEMQRNKGRLHHAFENVRYGKISGAVGTYAHTGPFIEKFVCDKMGLKPAPLSTQVLQRDRHAELAAAMAICGASVEKIATEVRNLQRTEIREVEEPFGKKQKGSSAMPHKRNPVVCEQMCGLARILRANVMPALEDVALWHERDISHSSVERIILADSTTLLDYMLKKITWVAENMHFYPENMMSNLDKTRGLLFSQKIMLELVDRGLSREDAYSVVQTAAMKSWKEKSALRDNLLADPEFMKIMSPENLDGVMDYRNFLTYVDEIYDRMNLE